jgi:hypothetical protein
MENVNNAGPMSPPPNDENTTDTTEVANEHEPPPPFGSIDGAALLVEVRTFLARFIVAETDDLCLVTLWIAHTFLSHELRTSPRLLIDSIVPGSGKTTLLEHLDRLCLKPLLAAMVSAALIPRLLDVETRSLLLDEVQRTLRPDKPGVEDLMAIINSGYRVGAKKPVLVPRGRSWDVVEMTIFCPLAMAGNSPHLPQDTVDRALRVLLMPDNNGSAEDSDWDSEDGIAQEAKALSDRLARWAESVREHVKEAPGELPKDCTGRFREKWRPLRRVAELAEFHNGEHEWKDEVTAMVARDLEEAEEERRSGLRQQPPGLVLMCDLYEVWPKAPDGGIVAFVATAELIKLLIEHNPSYWGASLNPPHKKLNATRLGRMIRQATKATSSTLDATSVRPGGGGSPRGYYHAQFQRVWQRLQVPESVALRGGLDADA